MKVQSSTIDHGLQPAKHTAGPWAWVEDYHMPERAGLYGSKHAPVLVPVPAAEYEAVSQWTDRTLRPEDKALIEDCPELLRLLRELHDFGEPTAHWRYAEQAKQVFHEAGRFLKKHNA